MLKREITYEDPFEGEEVTKTFYFNLTRAEITQWEFSVRGGLRAHLESIMQDPDENAKDIMGAIEDLIHRSYGKRDGSNFIKNEQIWEEFKSSEPYSQLFWELCTDAEKAAEFMNAIVPKDMAPGQEQLSVDPVTDRAQLGVDPVTRANLTEVPKPEPRVLTRAEMLNMDHEELTSGLAEGRYILGKELQ